VTHLNIEIDAWPANSALARLARINAGSRGLELLQTFDNGVHNGRFEFTTAGPAFTIFSSQLNLEVKILSANSVEFKAPMPSTTNISTRLGDWHFLGAMGVVMTVTFGGNPQIVQDVMAPFAALDPLVTAVVASVGALGAMLISIGQGALQAAEATAGVVPLFIFDWQVDYLRQQMEGPGGAA
jgi:hypothetical protein